MPVSFDFYESQAQQAAAAADRLTAISHPSAPAADAAAG